MSESAGLAEAADRVLEALRRARQSAARLRVEEIGIVTSIGSGVAMASGLGRVQSQELLRLPGGRLAVAFNLDPDEVGMVLLDAAEEVNAGDVVRRTGRVLDVPVGDALLGRSVDPLGRPLDGRGPVDTAERRPVERDAPAIMDRAPVRTPLETGLKVVDAVIPVGRGQRELILGDRQTGKTAIAVDTILNQRGRDVACVYCAIGQRSTAVARVVDELDRHGATEHTTVVSTTEDDPPGLRWVAAYAAMSMAEHYRDRGDDAMVVLDDLTRHARAYREMALLLRRPPGREAYPGDVFYIHSRLLERATRLSDELGGGSVTALPIIETEAQNLSAYIPTNLISITDGQVYLSPGLFQKGLMPAVDVGRSVSRVGGDAQLAAYKEVAGDLRLAYSRFEELESFARFGTRLDPETRRTLDRGRRVRQVLTQPRLEPIPVEEQIAVLLAVTEGRLDDVPLESVDAAEEAIREAVREHAEGFRETVRQGKTPSDEQRRRVLEVVDDAVAELRRDAEDAGRDTDGGRDGDGDDPHRRVSQSRGDEGSGGPGGDR